MVYISLLNVFYAIINNKHFKLHINVPAQYIYNKFYTMFVCVQRSINDLKMERHVYAWYVLLQSLWTVITEVRVRAEELLVTEQQAREYEINIARP